MDAWLSALREEAGSYPQCGRTERRGYFGEVHCEVGLVVRSWRFGFGFAFAEEERREREEKKKGKCAAVKKRAREL
jgi:hypothetical protein